MVSNIRDGRHFVCEGYSGVSSVTGISSAAMRQYWVRRPESLVYVNGDWTIRVSEVVEKDRSGYRGNGSNFKKGN